MDPNTGRIEVVATEEDRLDAQRRGLIELPEEEQVGANKAILLVTGSRAYPGGPAVFDMVSGVLKDFAARHPGHEPVLVHGDCPHPRRNDQRALSIDQVAASVGEFLGYRVKAVPIDHSVDGPWPAAGPRRNARMVAECVRERDAGAIVEVAGFPHPDPSKRRGTNGCLKLARAAGLGVIRG